ncbi:MAG: hypothetical protein A2145_02085 [candidate division Zixibacteria bacterium RBG_16_40_9]|nr:MAG: hypothetical protein A2145_02085 [candidate division Zixibacteria bacterium RBG_16_40_9]
MNRVATNKLSYVLVLYLRKMKYLVIASLIIASYLFSIAYGYTSEATMIFLTMEPDARSYGMGGVGVAITGGPQASFYNPAAIGNIRRFSFAGNRFDFGYTDLGSIHLSAGYKFGEYGTGAFNFTRFGLGSSISIDEFGNITKSSSYEELVSGSYSMELSPNFYVGASGKYISSSVFAFDFGILVTNLFPEASYIYYPETNAKLAQVFNSWVEKGFSIGAAISNLGPDVRYGDNERKDPLPRLLKIGIAWRPIVTEMFQTTLAADYEKSLVGLKSGFLKEFFDPEFFISKYGMEVNFFYVWTFRLGYRQDYEEEDHYLTSGFGFGPHWINFNIASGSRGGNTRYSLIFNYPLDLK